MMKNYRKLRNYSIFVLGFWAVGRFCSTQTDSFSAGTIDRTLVTNQAFEVEPLSPAQETEISHLLSQPFYYWSKGGQNFVFLGQDGKTVLKFFKKNHPFPDVLLTFLDKILPPYRSRFFQTREERFHSIFSSCKLAYEKLKPQTALLYLHLNPTPGKHQTLTIIDKIGCRHQIELDSTSFLLQERADLFFCRLKRQIAANDLKEAKQTMRSMLSYLTSQSKKGIRDTDNALKRNYGFVGDTPVCIDVGSFIFDPSLQRPSAMAKEFLRKTRRLRKLLKTHSPALLTDYKEMFEEIGRSC